jgi:hypothetical protein
VLYKNLDTLPFYAVPKEFMATTPEQIAMCTAGSTNALPDWIVQSGQKVDEKQLMMGRLANANLNLKFVEPDEAQHSHLIHNFMQFPMAAQRYAQTGTSVKASAQPE